MGKSFKLLFFSGAINDKQIVIVPEGNIQFCKDVRSIYHLHKRKTFYDLKNLFANTTYMSKTRHSKCFKCMPTGIRWNGICRNNHITPYKIFRHFIYFVIGVVKLFYPTTSAELVHYILQQRKQSLCRNRLSIYHCI